MLIGCISSWYCLTSNPSNRAVLEVIWVVAVVLGSSGGGARRADAGSGVGVLMVVEVLMAVGWVVAVAVGVEVGWDV